MRYFKFPDRVGLYLFDRSDLFRLNHTTWHRKDKKSGEWHYCQSPTFWFRKDWNKYELKESDAILELI